MKRDKFEPETGSSRSGLFSSQIRGADVSKRSGLLLGPGGLVRSLCRVRSLANAQSLAGLILLIVILVGACSSSSESEPSLTETEFVGKVVGYDGQPMPAARVLLTRFPVVELLESADADETGQFKLRTDKTGVLLLRILGVHHQSETVSIYVEEPSHFEIEAQLTTPSYREQFGDLILRTEPPAPEIPFDGMPLTRQEDGTYLFDRESAAAGFAYSIEGARSNWQAVAGTQSEGYLAPENYAYSYLSNVNRVDGRVRIIFDPMKLPRSTAPADIRLVGASDRQVRFDRIMRQMLKRQDARFDAQNKESYRRLELAQAAQDAGTDFVHTEYRPQPPEPAEIRALEEGIGAETDPLIKKLLLMSYLHLTAPLLKSDPELIEEALQLIEPESPLWWWQARRGFGLANRLGDAISQTSNPEAYRGYWLKILNALPDERITARDYAETYTMLSLLGTDDFYWGWSADGLRALGLDADSVGREALTRFPDDPSVQRRVAPHFVERTENIAPGKRVPEFSATSIDDPAVVYTHEKIDAKVYLIDFWATWCPPCVAALPDLHRLYEEFGPIGFEILSYSFDGSPEVVQNFRRDKWPMPWLNAMDLEKGNGAEISKAFEIQTLPKTVLVNREGEILAVKPSASELKLILENELN